MKASMSAAPPSPEMAPEPSRAPLPKLPAATMEEFRELENALKDKATATALVCCTFLLSYDDFSNMHCSACRWLIMSTIILGH